MFLNRKMIIGLLAAALVWCSLAHLFFLWHAGPVRDDFNRAVVTGSLSKYLLGFYRVWSGRWAAHGLQIALARRVDLFRDYPWLLLMLTTVAAVGCYAFVSLVTRPGIGRAARLGMAWLLAVHLWVTMPEPGEVIYWFSGGVEYLLPVMGGVTLMAWLRRAERARPGAARWGHALGLALLTLVITGLHEVQGLLLLVILVLILAYRRWRKLDAGLVGLLVALAVLGFLVALAAPGNLTRHEAYGALMARSPVLLVRSALKIVQIMCAQFLLVPSLILLSVLVLASDAAQVLGTRWLDRDRWLFRTTLPVLAVALPLGLMGAAMVGGLMVAPARLIDAAFMVFVFGWILSLIAWLPSADEAADRPPRNRRARYLLGMVFGLFVLSLIMSGNSYQAASDAVLRLRPWTEALHVRQQQMREAAAHGIKHISLPPLPPKPLLYPYGDLFANPKHPLNRGYAQYFGLTTVEVKPK